MYIEFQIGNRLYEEKHWLGDSIFIDGELAYKIGLEGVLISCIDGFDPSAADYSLISKETWKLIKARCNEKGGDLKEAMDEVKDWCDNVLDTHGFITVVGY